MPAMPPATTARAVPTQGLPPPTIHTAAVAAVWIVGGEVGEVEDAEGEIDAEGDKTEDEAKLDGPEKRDKTHECFP